MNYNLNRALRFTSLLLFAVFAFSFFHSEISDSSLYEEHHVSHDYCQLIKGTVVHTGAMQMAKILNFSVEKDLFIDLNDFISTGSVKLLYCNTDYYISPPAAECIYKTNMSFLI